MEKVSAVMYSIANFFTWILALCAIAGIVFSGLAIAGVQVGSLDMSQLGTGSLIYCAIILIVALITIAMVRRAKAKGTSKAWDVFFMICGIIGANIFYFLGGLFGLIARR